jgi:hypothetical protein
MLVLVSSSQRTHSETLLIHGCSLPGRYFLDQVAGWILELDRGKGIPFEGNYSAWLEAKNKRLSSESKSQVSSTWCTRLLVSDQPSPLYSSFLLIALAKRSPYWASCRRRCRSR